MVLDAADDDKDDDFISLFHMDTDQSIQKSYYYNVSN